MSAEVESIEVNTANKTKELATLAAGDDESSEEDLKASDTTKGATQEGDEQEPGFGLPLREFTMTLPGMKEPVSFNPLVSLIGVVFLWGLSLWSMVRSFGSRVV